MCGRCADDVCDAALRRRGEGQRKDRIQQALVYAGAGGCCLHARRDGIRRSAVARGGPFGRLSVLARVGGCVSASADGRPKGPGFRPKCTTSSITCRGMSRPCSIWRICSGVSTPSGRSIPTCSRVSGSAGRSTTTRPTRSATKGYAMENVWSGGKVFVAGRLGAGLNFRLSDCVLLGVEVNADMLSDKFNSKKAGNVDWQFNALAGLTFRFGKTYRKKAAAVPPAPVAPAAPAEPAPSSRSGAPARTRLPLRSGSRRGETRSAARGYLLPDRIVRDSGVGAAEGGGAGRLPQGASGDDGLRDGLCGCGHGRQGPQPATVDARAAGVSEALQQAGIAADRIRVDYKGDSEQPFATAAEKPRERLRGAVIRSGTPGGRAGKYKYLFIGNSRGTAWTVPGNLLILSVFRETPFDDRLSDNAFAVLCSRRAAAGREPAVIDRVRRESGAEVIVALKACAMWSIFPELARHSDGATASSAAEARLVFEEFGRPAHTYAPVYTDRNIDEILRCSDHITFNSVAQFERFGQRALIRGISCGLRINPEYSPVGTDLYNPCVPGSRLGVTAGERASARGHRRTAFPCPVRIASRAPAAGARGRRTALRPSARPRRVAQHGRRPPDDPCRIRLRRG